MNLSYRYWLLAAYAERNLVVSRDVPYEKKRLVLWLYQDLGLMRQTQTDISNTCFICCGVR